MSARDELAKVIAETLDALAANPVGHPTDDDLRVTDAILAAGYSKPAIIGYVVVDRDGKAVRNFDTQAEAQAFAAEYTEDCKDAGIDWDYRVATITEAQQ